MSSSCNRAWPGILTALLTPLIAVIVAYIAFRQWRTARPEVTKRPDFTHKRTYQEHSGATAAGNPPKEPLGWRLLSSARVGSRESWAFTKSNSSRMVAKIPRP
jgi:hypothetical protein